MKLQKRRGFTLVELLIVIVVIGILASGMMLAAGGATDSAKAATAISELRNAKAAGLLWFADNAGKSDGDAKIAWGSAVVIKTGATGTTAWPDIIKQMDNAIKSDKIIIGVNADFEYFIGTTAYQELGTLKKIATQGSGFVYFTTNQTTVPVSDDLKTLDTRVAPDGAIWVKVR